MITRIGGKVLVIAILCIFAVGCGGSTGKDIYKDKDKPRPAEKEK